MESNTKYKVALLCVLATIWVAIDQWTKSLFATADVGDVFGSTLGGLVKFVLVHNTGAAWGIFNENTVALGIFSLAVVAGLIAYFIYARSSVNYAQTIGIALIVAGGIGNAIDRFAQGFVTDFIAVTFIDFPVFNVADIGVTCGVVIFFIGLLVAWREESTMNAHDSAISESGAEE